MVKLPDELERKYEPSGRTLSGGSAQVIEAVNRSLRRQRVAIKLLALLPPDDEGAQEALERFRQEAAIACGLHHEHIVHINDYGEDKTTAWIVMDWVDGGSLKTVLDRGEPLPLGEIVRLMGQLLNALAYAHAQGVVHRDIKPANVLFTPEQDVRLADFGIARIESSTLTQDGTLMGTPAYMAPEQLRYESVDARADLWAAGVVLYQMLTGKKPFDAKSSGPTLRRRILDSEPEPPSQALHTIPAAFDAVIQRALAKDRNDRYASAAEFADAIRQASLQEASAAASESDGEETVIRRQDGTGSDDARDITARGNPPRGSAADVRGGAANSRYDQNAPQALKAEDARGTTGPSAQQRAAAPSAGSASRAWWRHPYLLGAVAAVSLALGILPFVIPVKDTKTKPVPPEAVSPPTLKPAPQNFAAYANQALGGFECARLSARLDGDTAVISGHVATQSDRTAITAKLGGFPEVRAVNHEDVRVVPLPHCRTVSFFSPYVDARGQAPRIGLKGGVTSLVEGEKLVTEVITGDRPGFVYADLYDTQGHVAHLMPNSQHSSERRGARERITLGERGMHWTVEPPLGAHLLVVIVSKSPLFASVRSEDVEDSQAYIRALDDAMSASGVEDKPVVHYAVVEFIARK